MPPAEKKEDQKQPKREHRRGYWLGVTPGEWIIIVTFLLGGTATVTTYAGAVDSNTEKIEAVPDMIKELKQEMVSEIQQSESRTSLRFDRLEQRMRKDGEETRRIMMEILRTQ